MHKHLKQRHVGLLNDVDLDLVRLLACYLVANVKAMELSWLLHSLMFKPRQLCSYTASLITSKLPHSARLLF